MRLLRLGHLPGRPQHQGARAIIDFDASRSTAAARPTSIWPRWTAGRARDIYFAVGLRHRRRGQLGGRPAGLVPRLPARQVGTSPPPARADAGADAERLHQLPGPWASPPSPPRSTTSTSAAAGSRWAPTSISPTATTRPPPASATTPASRPRTAAARPASAAPTRTWAWPSTSACSTTRSTRCGATAWSAWTPTSWPTSASSCRSI